MMSISQQLSDAIECSIDMYLDELDIEDLVYSVVYETDHLFIRKVYLCTKEGDTICSKEVEFRLMSCLHIRKAFKSAFKEELKL